MFLKNQQQFGFDHIWCLRNIWRKIRQHDGAALSEQKTLDGR